VQFASTGCMAKPMRRSETGGHSARVVDRRLPRHNYPRTVYLRPLFNLQLMFQIAINPRQRMPLINDDNRMHYISAIQRGLSS